MAKILQKKVKMTTYYKHCDDSDFIYRVEGNREVTRVFTDRELPSLFTLVGILNLVSSGVVEMMDEQEYKTFMTLRELER